MKVMDTKVRRDVVALADDIRRVRNDLADLRSRRRARKRRSQAQVVVEGLESGTPEAAVYVEEPGPQEKEVVVEQARPSARVLAVVFGLGTLVAVLLMRRSKATVAHLPRPSHRWRPRFRRAATRTVRQGPVVEEVPLRGAAETMLRERSTTEGLPLP